MSSSIIPLYKKIDKEIVRSKDCYLYDSDNNQYIDFESGDWSANIGHSNNRINQIIKNQVDLLIHDGLRFRNRQSEDLSNLLLKKLAFEHGKCVFLNSGSEAVNLGLTIAKNITKRKKILKMDCSYLSAFGHGQISENNTDLVNIPFDDISAITQFDFQEIAAFIFEPGNSGSLIKYPSNEFIKAIAEKIKENGGLLMVNEVTTGFGRTGKWFGYQHYDFSPDIVSMGKALGNGYPISCVSINQKTSNLFNDTPFRYAQSHQNDPLGCAVGYGVVSVLNDDELIPECWKKGLYFNELLIQLQAKHINYIKDIRARGLMIALEFHSIVNAEDIYHQLIDKGLLVGCKENVLRFMPPLIIERNHIDKLVETIAIILKNLKL